VTDGRTRLAAPIIHTLGKPRTLFIFSFRKYGILLLIDPAKTAENDGTRLRLIHTGIGEGEDWDTYYTSVSLGWSAHLNNLTAWLESSIKLLLETGEGDPFGSTGSRLAGTTR
jgi:hypothetical protein